MGTELAQVLLTGTAEHILYNTGESIQQFMAELIYGQRSIELKSFDSRFHFYA